MRVAVPKLDGLHIIEDGEEIKVVKYPGGREKEIFSGLLRGEIPDILIEMASSEGARIELGHVDVPPPGEGGRRLLMEAVREIMSGGLPRDQLVIQLVGLLDDLTRAENALEERLGEIAITLFPTVERDEAIRRIREGKGISEDDREVFGSLAETVEGIGSLRERVKGKIDREMRELCPNLSEVATPYVAALLLERAGGLDRLARMPASTIQVLGAERSLMAHLRKGRKPPKHGIIYQHPWVFSTPKRNRGKVARALAAKIAIAARLDAAGGPDRGRELRESLLRRIGRLLPKRFLEEAGEAD